MRGGVVGGKVMEERRRYVRLDTSLKITYHVLELPSPPTGAGIADIGGGGIRLFLDEPQKSGTLLDLEFILPDGKRQIHCQGKIVWTDEFSIYQSAKEETKQLEAGIEFTKIDSKDRDSIIKYVILGYIPTRERS